MVNELDEPSRPIRSRLGYGEPVGCPSSVLQRGNGIRRPRTTTAPTPDELGERFCLPGERVQHRLVTVVGIEHRQSFVSGGTEDLDRDEVPSRMVPAERHRGSGTVGQAEESLSVVGVRAGLRIECGRLDGGDGGHR